MLLDGVPRDSLQSKDRRCLHLHPHRYLEVKSVEVVEHILRPLHGQLDRLVRIQIEGVEMDSWKEVL